MKFFKYIVVLLLIISGCGKKEEPKTSTQPDTQNKASVKSDTASNDFNRTHAGEKGNGSIDDLNNKILQDPNGQWAGALISAGGTGDFTVEQLTGAPNSLQGKEDANAWTITDKSKQVTLKFDKEVNATEIRIKQNLNPGSIVKVELLDAKGKSYTVYEGIDRNDYSKSSSFFIASFNTTPYKTNTVRITADPDAIEGVKQIDAVQLVGKF